MSASAAPAFATADAPPRRAAGVRLALAASRRTATAAGSPAGAAVRRGDELGVESHRTLPSGFATLDAALPGGGWPTRALTEVLAPQPGLVEWRLLAPALAALAAAGRTIVVVAPPAWPHPPGLAGLGIGAPRLLWVRADRPAERLWAVEQFVRAGACGAVLAWLPQVRAEQLRRLHVGAQQADAPLFVCRPEPACHEPSAAPLRLAARVGRDGTLVARVVKRRGPPLDVELALCPAPPGLRRLLASPPAPRAFASAPDPAPRAADDALGRAAAAERSARAGPVVARLH